LEKEARVSVSEAVATPEELRARLSAALRDEIEHLRKEGGSTRYILRAGELVGRIGSSYVYRFRFEGEGLQDDVPARLRIVGFTDQIDAEVVSVEGLDVLISVQKHLGERVAEAHIFTDPIFLLEALRERIESSENIPAFNFKMANCLFGFEPAGLSQAVFNSSSLNEFQNKAVSKALGSQVFFIWGPPGTGKTTTLAALLQQAFTNGETLLLTSNTNVAVDNALVKVEREIRDTPGYSLGELVRLGTPQAPDFPETLLPSKIAARMSVDLDSKIAELELRLSNYSLELDMNRELLSKAKEASKIQAMIAGNDDLQRTYSQRASESERRLVRLRERLQRARAANVFTRVLRHLDPAELEAEVKAELNVEQDKTRAAELQAAGQKLSKEYDDLARALDGKSERLLSEQITSIEQRMHADRMEIEKLRRDKQEIEREVVRNARIIGATLAKSWMRPEVYQRGFDSVVVDEASMATLPMLYFVCALAKKRTTLAGDFKQLPAIVVSNTENAKHWLKRNIFESAGIGEATESGPKLEMLRRQYRMNPQISALVNRHVYGGRLLDDESVLKKATRMSDLPPGAGSALILCDTSRLKPWSTFKKGTRSRINLIHASLAIQLARVAKFYGFTEIGIITPYRAQARFIRKLAADAGFDKEVEVATVHRFQGREKQIIIFDVSDSEPHDPSRLVAGSSPDHLRLLNVAISRPQDKLVLIANLGYVSSKIDTRELLAKILFDVRSGKIIDGRELLELREGEIKYPIEEAKSIAHFSQDEFYASFEHDILQSKEYVTIICPFITKRRVETLIPSMSEAVRRKITVTVITREPKAYLDDKSPEKRSADEGIGTLRSLGATVKFAPEKPMPLHQKIAVIDGKILWHGSLNILSHRDTTESMLRLEGDRAPIQLLRDLEAAPEKKAVPIEIRKLRESMRGVTAEGTVVDIGSPRTVKTKHGELTTVTTATLSNSHAAIKLTLWGAQVYQIRKGSHIRVVNGYTSLYKGELVLQTGKYGRIELLITERKQPAPVSKETKWIPQNPNKRYGNGRSSWWAEQARKGHLIEWELNERGYTGRVRVDGEILTKESARRKLWAIGERTE
jgi:hypothetical protein